MVMKIDTMLRHFREAYRGVRKNAWMSFAAVSAVAVTLFIFGIFLIVAFNVRFLASELDKQVAIKVALNPQLTVQQQRQFEKEIREMPDVKVVQFVSKEEGLKEMKARWGEDGEEMFRGMDTKATNPIPDTFNVQPKNPRKVVELANKLREMTAYVEDVDYAKEVTMQMLSFSGWVRNVVLGFALGLAFLAAFLISNTIKLTIVARRKEIEVQRLVGASNWFIRWPFFIEGAFIGLVGAIVPTVIILVLYQAALSTFLADNTILRVMPMASVVFRVGGSIFLLGAFIGIWGSAISIRRFLKI